jgi:hypothetical protein
VTPSEFQVSSSSRSKLKKNTRSLTRFAEVVWRTASGSGVVSRCRNQLHTPNRPGASVFFFNLERLELETWNF